MEASFSTFDYLGEPVGSGTLTVDFLKPGFQKLTVHDGASADKYAPEDQEAIGVDAPPTGGSFMQRLLVDLFLHPGPSKKDLESGKLKEKNQKLGAVTLRCITLEPPKAEGSKYKPAAQVYCLSADAPLLRASQQRYGLEAVYNQLVRFGSRTVAKDVSIQQRGKVRAKLTVLKLIAAPNLKEADFPKQVDSQVHLNAGMAKVGAGVQAGHILSKIQPVYPLEAKQDHISGSVVLHAIIGKDGAIEDLEVISAPSESLAEASIDAVSQWKYEPYLLNGKATEVDTTITVYFSFG